MGYTLFEILVVSVGFILVYIISILIPTGRKKEDENHMYNRYISTVFAVATCTILTVTFLLTEVEFKEGHYMNRIILTESHLKKIDILGFQELAIFGNNIHRLLNEAAQETSKGNTHE